SVQLLIEARVARGKSREIVFDLIDAEVARGVAKRIILIGVGKAEKLDEETIRQAAGAMAKAVKKHRLRSISIVPPVLKTPGLSGAEATVTGFLLASFDYDEYRGTASRKRQTDEPSPKQVELTILATRASMKQLAPAVERGRVIAEAQNFA